MRKMIRGSLIVIAVVSFLLSASPATAGNPGGKSKNGKQSNKGGGTSLAAAVNPNGFPSGAHYNLNIHGKKDGFTCPAQEVDEFGNPIYGNSIFVPENGNDIQIYIQSGKGTRASAFTELRAVDPCAVFDGDGAEIQLPRNDAGYRVYARALAKPTDEPSMTIVPSLYMVQDELGNDLIYLGLATSGGFQMPDGTFIRKAGRSKAVDITGMFEWTGEVCYFTDPGVSYTPDQICCIDSDANGVYEACELPSVNDLGVEYCATPGYALLTAYCVSYVDEWVFNIGDLVTLLWSVDNSGLKLLQVRFYPN